MAYATTQDVADLTPWLLGTEENFTKTTSPTKAAVGRWLDKGAADINTALAARGYSVPVGADATIYGKLTHLNALWAAEVAESTRMSSRVAVTERSRSQMLETKYNKALGRLFAMDLSQAGVGHTTQIKAGGISRSDKRSVESDTDRVAPRFERGQFDIPGGARPSGDDRNSERD